MSIRNVLLVHAGCNDIALRGVRRESFSSIIALKATLQLPSNYFVKNAFTS